MELKNMVALASPRTGRHLQVYDHKGCRVVVGCIPYRYKVPDKAALVEEDSLEVLVISAQRKGKGMLFPKGGWEKDENILDAAQRETIEEAGVVGDITMCLGKWELESQNKEGYMYGLLVKEQLDFWPEKDKRQRVWMSVEEARRQCRQKWMNEALEKLVKHLSTEPNMGSSGSSCQDWRCNL